MLHEKLIVYQEALRLAEDISKAAAKWPRGYYYLIDQIKRAMSSVVLNVAEGNGRESGKERRRFFVIAKGSIAEVSACIDLATVFQLIGPATTSAFKSRSQRIDRLLWGLIK